MVKMCNNGRSCRRLDYVMKNCCTNIEDWAFYVRVRGTFKYFYLDRSKNQTQRICLSANLKHYCSNKIAAATQLPPLPSLKRRAKCRRRYTIVLKTCWNAKPTQSRWHSHSQRRQQPFQTDTGRVDTLSGYVHTQTSAAFVKGQRTPNRSGHS